ncbi:TRAP transporter small permease subunit [Alphaproteobacteria bacterium LSUCC0684]
MKYLLAGIDRLSGAFGWIAGLLIVPLVFASVFEVISRYVFNAPTIWAYEIGYMATGTNFFLGMSYALRERAHIRIDVLYSHFSPRTQSLVDALGYTFLMLPFVIWLTWRLGLYAYDAWIWGERSGESAWNPVIWPYRVVFVLGFLLLTLQSLAEWFRSLMVLAGKAPPRNSD